MVLISSHTPKRASAAAKQRRYSHYLCAALVSTLLMALQLILLAMAPYSSCLLARAPLKAALDRPCPNFRLGPVEWHVSLYARDPHLEPLRAYFRSTCGRKTGAAAAIVLSDRFASRFAFGQSAREFFGRTYDPVTDLFAHIKGEPGHCVTRSGLTSAILLSAGIPARVVQLAP